MASPARPTPVPLPSDERPRFKPHPDDEQEIRAAAEDITAGRVVRVTLAEVKHWAATGEWPDSLT